MQIRVDKTMTNVSNKKMNVSYCYCCVSFDDPAPPSKESDRLQKLTPKSEHFGERTHRGFTVQGLGYDAGVPRSQDPPPPVGPYSSPMPRDLR